MRRIGLGLPPDRTTLLKSSGVPMATAVEHENWCHDYDKTWDCSCGATARAAEAERENEEKEESEDCAGPVDSTGP
jgi:hypothetical protein